MKEPSILGIFYDPNSLKVGSQNMPNQIVLEIFVLKYGSIVYHLRTTCYDMAICN